MQAQARELKILSCLDRHVNVVSLLGAVTNVEKGALILVLRAILNSTQFLSLQVN